MRRQKIFALSSVLLACSLLAHGQSKPSTASLTVAATVVGSVGVEISPGNQYRLVTANAPASDNLSHLNLVRNDQANTAITFSFPAKPSEITTITETHDRKMILGGKTVHCLVKTTTVVPR